MKNDLQNEITSTNIGCEARCGFVEPRVVVVCWFCVLGEDEGGTREEPSRVNKVRMG